MLDLAQSILPICSNTVFVLNIVNYKCKVVFEMYPIGSGCYKHFIVVIYKCSKKARVFVPGRLSVLV
jgi:hypothetical protein